MDAKERLIKELGDLEKTHSNSGVSHKLSYTMKRWELELVAQFILDNRKRIIAPLIKICWPEITTINKVKKHIDEAIRLSEE